MADVIFSAFDERAGPVAIYSTINDPVLTKKIAVKSIVSTLTSVRTSSSERLEGEAIIPFPNENRIAFIFYTSLDQKTEGGEYRVISLSAVVPNEKKTGLYSNATILSQNAVEIKDTLNASYTFGQPVSREIEAKLKAWGELTKTQEMAIIAEKEMKFGLRSLFEIFPPKKSIRSYEDPLVPVFLGAVLKIPVVLVGPNVEFLLEISDIIREFMPGQDLDVRLSIALDYKSQAVAMKIPRADIILLNEEQDKRKNFYRDPVILAGMGKSSRYINYSLDVKAEKVIESILKKARDFNDEMVANHYLEGEFLSLFSKMTNLKDYCLTGRQGKPKDVAKNFDVDEDYILLLAEALRTRKEASAQTINKMFQNETEFAKMDIRSPKNVGFIR
ncbi:MAG: hypothetical protein EAX86_09705 [Candidatus Heimdallarchaeota archaeon]|nr:hypothetical protein [Candidatus Heimdallarchaeota archaeon]